MNLLASILVVLVMGASLQRCRRALAAPAAPQPRIKPPCVDEEISFTADQQCELYIDGSAVGSLPNANTWQVAKWTTMRSTARVLAFKATRAVGRNGGLLVSGSRFVTNGSWKCTNTYENGWSGVNFDDSAWPKAVVMGNHGMNPWGYIPDISNASKWIWTTRYIYGLDTDIIIYCRMTRDYCECTGTGQSCISDCESVDGDGNYQSCLGCQFYASCYYGYLYDEQPCEEEGFVWDDNLKSCEKQSSTCKCCSNNEITTTVAITTQPTSKTTRATTGTTTLTTPETTTPTTRGKTVCTTGPRCIASCQGLPNGAYQSCNGCHFSIVCHYGSLKAEPPCSPAGYYWDDYLKKCEIQSATCKICPGEETTTTSAVTTDPTTTRTTRICTSGPTCITSCTYDLPDGYYQLCKDCRVYAKCSFGKQLTIECGYDKRLFWDDRQKSCVPNSTTCRLCQNDEPTTTSAVTTDPATTKTTTVCTSGPTCITSCTYGLPDGYYQLCKGCDVYANCSNGELACELSCGYEEQLFWDDNEKCCVSHSTTCQSCPNEEATTTTLLTVTDDRKPTTTSEVCPTESQHVSSCCNTGGDSSCYNKLFYFICKIISHL